MLSKFKNFFKLSNWKRWTILIFTFISSALFIGLTYGLKSVETKLSNDYKNGVSLVVKPYENGEEIDDEAYSRQLLFNLKTRLEKNYPDYFISSSFESGNVWKIDITNINNQNQQDELLKAILNRNDLTLTTINAKLNSSLYNSTSNNNFLFNEAERSSETYNLYMNVSDSKAFYNWAKSSNNHGDKVIIWKNYDILKEIMQNDESYTNDQSMYEYLFISGWTPEKEESKGENETTQPPKFKESFKTKDGKTYKAEDFLVSKNALADFNGTAIVTINKDFGSKGDSVSKDDIEKEFYDVSYWISSYSLENNIISPISATNGSHAYTFLIIALSSFLAIVSIFVVINYGYLGIFAILILAVIIFLALLMISVFFGDYDSVAVCAILLSTIIAFDFIVVFSEKIKKEFLSGNSISKSVKNGIKKIRGPLFIKAFLLILALGIFYGFVSMFYGNFSTIVLISSLAIPIIVIPLMILISNTSIGINKFENNPKLIGLWNKKYKNWVIIKDENNEISDEINIDEKQAKIPTQESLTIKKFKEKNQRRFLSFKKYYGKTGTVSLWTLISFVTGVGLLAFLVSFFVNGRSLTNALNISPYERELTVLRIAKVDGKDFEANEINEIKSILEKNGVESSNIDLTSSSLIQAFADKEFSSKKVNQISSEIMSLYNVIIIPSNLVSSQTFKIMQFSLYGILIAIVAMGIFVLIWTNWTKALTILISSLVSVILFVFMLGFSLVVIDPMISIALLVGFIVFLLSSTNIITKIHYKLKETRIEELKSDEIRELIYKQVFRSLKEFLIVNSLFIITFIIFGISFGSLPFGFVMFLLGTSIVNALLSLLLVPKLLIKLEISRARIKRKIILENYWDTEKIKEQTFKGINNIK